MIESDILDMLERLGKAVSDGDLKMVAACYGYPALFLSDEQTILLEMRSKSRRALVKAESGISIKVF